MKAVIMAGGAGQRLRPLTVTTPKPMVHMMGRPVMAYLLDLVKQHGISDVAVILQYMPDIIRNCFGSGEAFGLNMRYFEEQSPLGTAGSLRNAASFADETFIVLSGDAVTDIDIKEAYEFHKSRKALVTLVLKKAEVPLDYGVVVTEPDGRVTQLLEKPGWGSVLSDTVNTGIYVMEPDILGYIQPDTFLDFARDIFPRLLAENADVYACVSERYWCDIGDLIQYRQAHRDILDGKCKCVLQAQQVRPGVFMEDGAQIAPEAQIDGPAYLGAECGIGAGARIGPYAVIGEQARIGSFADAESSIVFPGARVERGAQLFGAIVCAGAAVMRDARMMQGSVLGERSVLGKGSELKPEARIWPHRTIPAGVQVELSVLHQNAPDVFAGNILHGVWGADLCAERMTQLGGAVCSLLNSRVICVACDSAPAAQPLCKAFISGVTAQGGYAFDLCETPMPLSALQYAQHRLDCDIGVYVSAQDGGEVQICFLERNGLPASNRIMRDIRSSFERMDFIRRHPLEVGSAYAVNGMQALYGSHLADLCDNKLQNKRVAMYLPYERGFYEQALRLTGMDVEWMSFRREWENSRLPGVCMDGTDVLLRAENCSPVQRQSALTLVCIEEMQNSLKTFTVPMDMPGEVERHARGRALMLELAVDPRQIVYQEQRFSPLLFAWYFDPLALFCALHGIAHRQNTTLHELLKKHDAGFSMERDIDMPPSAVGGVMRVLRQRQDTRHNDKGVTVARDKGRAVILPRENEPGCRLICQSEDEEYARELTDFFYNELNNIMKTLDE